MTARESVVVDYHRAPASSWGSRILVGVGSAVVVAVFSTMMAAVSRFEQIFKDFGKTLPAATEVLMRVSHWFRDDYGWAIVWLVPVLLPAVCRVAPQPKPLHPVVRVTLIVAAIVLVMVITVYVILGLPMIALIENISAK